MGHDQLLDSMIADGLTCPITHVHMGITAENVAAKYEHLARGAGRVRGREPAEGGGRASRAASSRPRSSPVEVPGAKKGETFKFETDEHPRAGTHGREARSRCRPAFKPDGGTVTAGNASGINDGAAAVVVMSDAQGEGARPHAARHASAPTPRPVSIPSIMGMGPWPASEKALEKAGLRKEEIDLWELNEAFAAQSLGVLRELSIPKNRVNVNGGAIALGHPIGASGARVLVTLLHAMADRDARLGVASLCIGGGQGIAMVVERA